MRVRARRRMSWLGTNMGSAATEHKIQSKWCCMKLQGAVIGSSEVEAMSIVFVSRPVRVSLGFLGTCRRRAL